MSANLTIVPFPEPTPESNALVETLRACVTQAEKGDVTAFMLVTLKRNGDVMRAHCRAPDADAFKLLGVLTHESRWLSERINEQNAVEDHLDDGA